MLWRGRAVERAEELSQLSFSQRLAPCVRPDDHKQQADARVVLPPIDFTNF